MEIHEKCFTELISQHNIYLLLQPHYFTNEKKKIQMCVGFFPLVEHFSSLLIFLIFSLFNICFTGKFLSIIYYDMLLLYFL